MSTKEFRRGKMVGLIRRNNFINIIEGKQKEKEGEEDRERYMYRPDKGKSGDGDVYEGQEKGS